MGSQTIYRRAKVYNGPDQALLKRKKGSGITVRSGMGQDFQDHKGAEAFHFDNFDVRSLGVSKVEVQAKGVDNVNTGNNVSTEQEGVAEKGNRWMAFLKNDDTSIFNKNRECFER